MKLATAKQLSHEYDRGYLARLFQRLDDQVNNLTEGKLNAITNAQSSAPTTGTYVAGDFVRNNGPIESGGSVVFGWMCTVSGTPGTWSQCQFSTNALYGYRAITALRTLDSTDELIDCTSGTFTVTLPTAVGFSRSYIIKNSGTGVITVATTSSQTIDGNLTVGLNQYDSITVRSTNANWILV